MAKKPPVSRTGARRSSVVDDPDVRVEEQEATKIDSADVILGVVLILAIPIVTYIVLDAANYPVASRSGQLSVEQAKARDKAILDRAAPAFQDIEFKERLDRIQHLLTQQIPHYESRIAQEPEEAAKRHLREVTEACLVKIETEIKELRAEMEAHSENAGWRARVDQHQNDVSTKRRQLRGEG